MLSNLTCFLIYSLRKCVLGFKTGVFWKFCKTCRNISTTEFSVKVVTVFRVVTFFNEVICEIKFPGIDEIFYITNSTNLDCQMWFQRGMINFDYSNFKIDNYSFFSSYEIIVGKNVNSSTCTAYGIYLRESIMTVLTPKSVINLMHK